MPTLDDIYEIRRKNIELLLRHFGSYANINEKLGYKRTCPHLSLIVNKKPRSAVRGIRRLGHKNARKFEQVLGFAEGWFDCPHIGGIEQSKVGSIRVGSLEVFPSKNEQIVQAFDVSLSLLESLGIKEMDKVQTFTMNGEDMNPTIGVGDKCIVDTRYKTCSEQGVYLLQVAETYIVRRAVFRLSGEISLSCDNTRLGVPEPLPENAQVLGRIVYVFKGFRV